MYGMASTSRMLRIFGRRLIESNITVKPIQNIFFQKPKTNNVGIDQHHFFNNKLLHSQNRQGEAGGKLHYKFTKSKWLQLGKLGLLVASTTAAAGVTYWTLLKDVKAGPKRNKNEVLPVEESLGHHQATEEVDLEDNFFINQKVEVFTKDELKEFCEKNPGELKFYAVSEQDVENNNVWLHKVSDDEYEKLINKNFDAYFKDETVNWIPLPWWNMSSKSESIQDTRNKNLRQFKIFGDYEDTEKDFLTFSPVEQELKSNKKFPIRVGKIGDLTLTARGESTFSDTKAKKEPQDDSIPTLEMRKDGNVIKNRYIAKGDKVESVTEASSKVPELDNVIKKK